MPSYQDIEQEYLKNAKQQTTDYAVKRRRQADDAAKEVDVLYSDLLKQTEAQYKQAARETEKTYRELYDLNAVSEQIALRNAEEAIANINMAKSGLNNTQQTAISLSRSRADAQTTKQKQDVVNAIMRELDAVRAENARQAMSRKQAIRQAAERDVLSFAQSASDAARDTAFAQYNAEKKAIAEQQKIISLQAKAFDQSASADTAYTKTVGSANAVKSNAPSLTAIKTDARIYLKRNGEAAARKYLNRCLENGYLTNDQRASLMAQIGISDLNAVGKGIKLTASQLDYYRSRAGDGRYS